MKLNTFMMSAAAAALFAGTAYAGSDSSATQADEATKPEMSAAVESVEVETSEASSGATDEVTKPEMDAAVESVEAETSEASTDASDEADKPEMSAAVEETDAPDTQVVAEPAVDVDTVLTAPEFTSLADMTVGDVIGLEVTDPSYAEIGEIDYVVPRGDSADAVIGIGGFLGLGEYTVALPLEEFDWDPEQGFLILASDKETLEQQPEFDESGAESLPDETPVASLLKASGDAASGEAEQTSALETETSDANEG